MIMVVRLKLKQALKCIGQQTITVTGKADPQHQFFNAELGVKMSGPSLKNVSMDTTGTRVQVCYFS
jgi:hypothetical protein